VRWYSCSLCEQNYHGIVFCALGWACWKTYVGWPEADEARGLAIGVLGTGLFSAGYSEAALSVTEAELSMERRIGAPEKNILAVQSNLANTYASLGRGKSALRIRQDVYSKCLRNYGEENESTFRAADNYAVSLVNLQLYAEAKVLLRKTAPMARRILGESNELTLRMRKVDAIALYKADGATLRDLREAVATLEDTARIARRVFGGNHPLATGIGREIQISRAALDACETPSGSSEVLQTADDLAAHFG